MVRLELPKIAPKTPPTNEISIPQWCDQNSFGSCFHYCSFFISIPQWCDQNEIQFGNHHNKSQFQFLNGAIRMLRNEIRKVEAKKISIPQWCDQNIMKTLYINQMNIFQFFNGAIRMFRWMVKLAQSSVISIPQWCDQNEEMRDYLRTIENFNSSMVRLEQGILTRPQLFLIISIPQWCDQNLTIIIEPSVVFSFQFLNGAIRISTLQGLHAFQTYFNSSMVRLE